MKRIVMLFVFVVSLLGVHGAEAQFDGNPANFVLLSQTQLGNLGYTRYRGFGARALGMGGAYIALADDLTAASWNPAGLAQITVPSLSAGLAYSSVEVDQKLAFDGGWQAGGQYYSQTMKESQPIPFSGSDSELHLDYLAGSYPFLLTDNSVLAISGTYFRSLVFDQNFSATADFANPLEVQFNRLSGSGSDVTGLFDIQDATASQDRKGYLDSYSGSAAISYRDTYFFGFTLSYWDGSLKGNDKYSQHGCWTREINNPSSQLELIANSDQDLDLNMSGFGVTLGGLVKLSKKIRFGVVYKPGYTLSVDGRIGRIVEITEQGTGSNPTTVRSDPRKFIFDDSDVDYPDSLGVGLAWEVNEKWTLALDWNQTAWKDTKLRGGEENQDSPDQSTPAEFTFPSLALVSSSLGDSTGYDQFDSTVWRFGAEYVARLKGGADLPLRFGVFHESAYRNVPGVGDGLDITGYSAGIGLSWGQWKFDVAAVYEDSDQGLEGAEFSEPRIAQTGTQNVSGNYHYLSGSYLSQSSFRMLANMTLTF